MTVFEDFAKAMTAFDDPLEITIQNQELPQARGTSLLAFGRKTFVSLKSFVQISFRWPQKSWARVYSIHRFSAEQMRIVSRSTESDIGFFMKVG